MRHRSSSARISAMPNNNPHSDFLILSGYLNLPYPTPTPCGFHLGSGLGYSKPEVATIFGVTVRTIERDLAKIKTEGNECSAT